VESKPLNSKSVKNFSFGLIVGIEQKRYGQMKSNRSVHDEAFEQLRIDPTKARIKRPIKSNHLLADGGGHNSRKLSTNCLPYNERTTNMPRIPPTFQKHVLCLA
jgi:hypothetical protein